MPVAVVKTIMSSTNKTALGLIQSCLLLAMLLGDGIATTPAIAQEQRSEREGDRDDSDDRRERFRAFRRDRGESGSDDRESRDNSPERESRNGRPDTEKSDDAPGIGMTDYAKGLVKKYDKNGNMMLDGDERQSLRPPASLADANNDNVITTEELVARLSGPTSKSSSGPSSKSKTTGDTSKEAASDDDKDSDRRDRGDYFGPRRSNSDSDKSVSDSKSATTSKRVLTWTGGGKTGDDEKKARRTYRFTPANEKLPTGLPSWFKSQDKNGDGQVAMSEYSRSWSKSTVAKFRGYDLNDDGVITAKEAGEKK
jgi:hypothetical protein